MKCPIWYAIWVDIVVYSYLKSENSTISFQFMKNEVISKKLDVNVIPL